MFNISRRSVQHATTVLKQGAPELQSAVQEGIIAVSTAAEIAERPREEQKAILDALPRDEAGKLTPEAKKEIRKVAKEVRTEDQAVKKQKRAEKEAALGAKIRALPEIKAGLIISDFEWHFKVRSEDTGMDRHASNHYVTAKESHTPEEIVERQRERMQVAADDCIHLMWCPASFNAIALKVMELQGFKYVSQFAWIKPGIGTGFWVRDKHELLLIGVRGKVPAPAMGDQFDSAIPADKGEHSEKPDFQYEIAEHYFPSLPKIELNARRHREGWIQWGNQLPDQGSLAVTEDNCPGHVASNADPKVCGNCGVHIDSLRPDEEGQAA
jgi:N6-adenosine-specific RNA methylase IME4